MWVIWSPGVFAKNCGLISGFSFFYSEPPWGPNHVIYRRVWSPGVFARCIKHFFFPPNPPGDLVIYRRVWSPRVLAENFKLIYEFSVPKVLVTFLGFVPKNTWGPNLATYIKVN